MRAEVDELNRNRETCAEGAVLLRSRSCRPARTASRLGAAEDDVIGSMIGQRAQMIELRTGSRESFVRGRQRHFYLAIEDAVHFPRRPMIDLRHVTQSNPASFADDVQGEHNPNVKDVLKIDQQVVLLRL